MTTDCPKCGTEVEIPESQRNAAKLLLKCSSCGHVFMRRSEEAPEEAAPAPDAPPPPAAAPESAAAAEESADHPPLDPSPDWGPGVGTPEEAAEEAEAAPAAAAGGTTRRETPAGADRVMIIRDFRSDKAKHLAARLLVDESKGKKSYSEFKEAFERSPYLIYGIGEAKLKELSEKFAQWRMDFEGGLISDKMCFFHPTKLRVAECPECGKPLCADCRSGGQRLCRDCSEAARMSEERRLAQLEKQARSLPVYGSVLPPDFAVAEVLELLSAEVILDEMAVISALVKGAGPEERKESTDSLETAKDKALLKMRRRARQIGADAIVGAKIDYCGFNAQGAAKSFLLVAASGTAVKGGRPPA